MTRGAETKWPAGSALMVLTGGASRRLGRDKATTHVGGRTLLDRLLAAVPRDVPVVVVGPAVGDPPRSVRFTREVPAGGGPLAAIGAGLELVDDPLVGVLAADMPFAVPVVGRALAVISNRAGDSDHPALGTERRSSAVGGCDAVVPVDDEGRPQLLCAAYQTAALRNALASLEPPAGRPVRAVLAHLSVMELPVSPATVADVDTEADLAAARARAAEEATAMQEWVEAVREALGLEVTIDIDAILDVARDAAHAVARPAAPVTTYLLGAAVAGGADPKQVAARIAELATTWSPPAQ